METTPRPALVDDPGIRFGIALGLVTSTLLVAGLAGLGTTASATAVVLVGGLAVARLPRGIALATGVVAWAFFTGFDVNSFGQLTFGSHDLVRLAVFAAATAACAGITGSFLRAGVRHG